MKVLLLFLILSSASIYLAHGFDFNDYKKMMRGFLTGIGVASKHLDHLLSCLTDQKHLEVDFVDLMNKIDVLDFKNMPLTSDLFVQLFDVIIISIVEIDICAADNPEYDRLFKKMYHMMPQTIYKRLMLNFVTNAQQLFKDIQDACDNYLHQRFERQGVDLGEIMDLVLFYKLHDTTTLSPASEAIDYTSFLKGLFEGMRVKGDLKKVLACAEKVKELAQVIEKAIEKLKNLDLKHIEEVLKVIVEIVKAVKEGIKELDICAGGVEEIKVILKKLSELNIEKIKQRLLKEILKIFGDIMKAKAAFEDGDFESFGIAIGDILYLLFLQDGIMTQ